MRKKQTSDSDYELLIEQHQRRLHEFIFTIFPNHTSVEDILQETNRVLWEKRKTFEEGTNFYAWARTIAQFQTLDYLKTSKRKSWLHFNSELIHTITSFVEKADQIREEKSDALTNCILKLEPVDQELVQLRYKDQLSLKEISKLTKRTEGALKQVFRRVRIQLKECIERRMLGNQVEANHQVTDEL